MKYKKEMQALSVGGSRAAKVGNRSNEGAIEARESLEKSG